MVNIILLLHRNKCSAIFKDLNRAVPCMCTVNKIYPQLEFLIWKCNSKLLSNCNRNLRSQPSGWISWLFLISTLCTYLEPINPKKNTKRAISLYPLPNLYGSLFSIWGLWGSHFLVSYFLATITSWTMVCSVWANQTLDINARYE